MTASGALLGALAAFVGIPIGIGFFQFAKAMSDEGEGGPVPALWSLALVVPASMVVSALATLLPATVAARRPPADALREQ